MLSASEEGACKEAPRLGISVKPPSEMGPVEVVCMISYINIRTNPLCTNSSYFSLPEKRNHSTDTAKEKKNGEVCEISSNLKRA